jgi:hypothetical protein
MGLKRETTGGISDIAITLSGNVCNKFYFDLAWTTVLEIYRLAVLQ